MKTDQYRSRKEKPVDQTSPSDEGPISGGTERLINVWWHWIPLLMSRISRMAQIVLADGLYLTAWPKIAAYAPPLALAVGLLLGGLRFAPGDTFSFSIYIMGIMLLFAGLGAGLGAWVWFGYCVTDLLIFHHLETLLFSHTSVSELLKLTVGLLIIYILLAMLLFIIPITSLGLCNLTLHSLKLKRGLRLVFEMPLMTALQAALVYVWAQSAPTLIRPLYTWQGNTPPVEAMVPLQTQSEVLVILAAILGGMRVLLQYFASSHPGAITHAGRLRQSLTDNSARRIHLPAWVSLPFKAAVMTLMLSGLILTWFEALVLMLVVTGILFGREVLVPRLVSWSRIVSRIPLLVRLAIGAFFSYRISLGIVGAMWSHTDTFQPLILSVVASLVVFAFLLPQSGSTLEPLRGKPE